MPDLATADWVVLALHLMFSGAVGYYASRAPARIANGGGIAVRKGASVDDEGDDEQYMLAGRNVGGSAIGISLVSGLCSGISYLGGPGFAYGDGAALAFMQLNYLVSAPFIAALIIPFYHRLPFITAYAYLECRFGAATRTVAAALFVLRTLLYLAIVLYAPALALSAVTPLPLWGTVLACGVLATAYTMKGGMATVIWTDFVQSLVLLGAALYVMAAVAVRVKVCCFATPPLY